MTLDPIEPDWPAPPRVRALATTRRGGVGRGPYDSLNLGTHVGDDAEVVAENRRRLGVRLPADPMWLEQVHGTEVAEHGVGPGVVRADACVARAPGAVCAVLTADCLPVLFCDQAGSVVAAAHAGWRGLVGGVLERTVEAMGVAPDSLIAWLGPAIGPGRFEVGGEVRSAFVDAVPGAGAEFRPVPGGKWVADLYGLARRRLAAAGVRSVHGGGWCTYDDEARFFSYRRDRVTGRQATLIWLEPA